MLVLTRRVGESIIIADEIQVAVISIRGDRVRIGIAAPSDIRVDRQEIHELRNEHVESPVYASHVPTAESGS